jgi:hypothetical protein
MLKEMLIRFAVGGLVVSVFSALGDVLEPKSFAGLFGAAPSVALATLGLTIATDGAAYAALEARSMIGGAIAMSAYACLAVWIMFKFRPSAMLLTTSLLTAWLAMSLSTYFFFLR